MFMKLNEENTYKVEGATLQNLRRDIVTYSTACSTVGSRRLKYEDVIATNAKNATRMNESDRWLVNQTERAGARNVVVQLCTRRFYRIPYMCVLYRPSSWPASGGLRLALVQWLLL